MRQKRSSHQYHSNHAILIEGTPVHPVLKSYFGYCLHKISSKMRSAFAVALEEHNVMPHHYGILIVLRESGSLSQQELGLQIGIDKASMVKIIDDLEALGFVSRKVSGADRRVNLIRMTSKGLRSLDKFSEIRQSVENEFMAPLSVEERKTLKNLMGKLLLQQEA